LTRLAPVIEDAVAAVALSAKTKGIRIDVECGSDSGVILGDPERLQQVVWNLLSNAVKFTPEGGRVEVRLEQVGASCNAALRSHNGRRQPRRSEAGVTAACVNGNPSDGRVCPVPGVSAGLRVRLTQ
jgi:signal transduction histidine kinase